MLHMRPANVIDIGALTPRAKVKEDRIVNTHSCISRNESGNLGAGVLV